MARADKKKYGSAVANGILRYLSASSLQAFSPDQDGGCHRRWHFEKIQGLKAEQKTWQTEGVDHHEKAAHYLESGEDVLTPVLRNGKHFLPAPGKDLLIEKGFGDFDAAIAMRDKVIAGQGSDADVEKLCISILGVPVMGEMDLRHRRGEWVDNLGIVHREDDPVHTAEVFDHKTTGNMKWAKDEKELIATIQMPLYAKATVFDWPDIEHVRISHGVYCTAKKDARKTTTLLHLPVINSRFATIENGVRAMMHVAKETDITKVEANLNSCDAFRGCDFRLKCPMSPDQVFIDLCESAKSSSSNTNTGATGMSLFDQIDSTPPAAPPTTLVLPASPDAPAIPAAPHVDETAYRAEVEVEKTQLAVNGTNGTHTATVTAASFGSCAKCGTAYTMDNVSRLTDGNIVHVGCPGAVPAAPRLDAVVPPDAPTPSFMQAADPMPAEEIAQIGDPAARARAEAHALQHATIAAAQAAVVSEEKDKSSVWCPGGKQRIPLTIDIALARKMNCASCGKEIGLKPAKEGEVYVATIPRHKPVGAVVTQPTAAATQVATEVPATTSAPPTPSVPAPPIPAPPVSTMAVVPPAPPAPPQVVAAPTAVVPPAPVVAPPAPTAVAPTTVTFVPVAPASPEGVSLFVDVHVERGPTLKPFEDYYIPIVRNIESAAGVMDVRAAQEKPLSFGGWKGVVAAECRKKPPAPGRYFVRGSDEIAMVVVEALAMTCDAVYRG